MRSYGQRQIDEFVREIALELRDPATNYVYQKQVTEALEKKLMLGVDPAVMSALIRSASASQVKSYFDRCKPKFGPQQSLYFPGFWLPLGAGKRVQMADASDQDLIAYGEGVQANRQKINVAADRTEEYVTSRVARLNQHPGRRLHWIEVNEFGYPAEEQDPEEFMYDEEED